MNLFKRICSPGTSVGINLYGAKDPSNEDTCYPTSDSAYVASCNNKKTNTAEMTIVLKKV